MRLIIALLGALLPTMAPAESAPPQIQTRPANDNSAPAASTAYVDGQLQARALTPQDFDKTAGTGGDDSAAINAAIAAAGAPGGPGEVFFPAPSSGFYNVCADAMRIAPTAGGTQSLTLRGPTGGKAPIRALPGCNSGAVNFATAYMEGTGFSENVKSRTKVTIENLRIDGYCQSRYTFYTAYAVGLTFRNSVLRNAKTGNGANFYQESGYQTWMDQSNRLENVNDAGHACYNTPADLPDYNLWQHGTDGHFAPDAVNARIANFYADRGGNNHFIGSHGWGYPGGTDGQPNLRPQYNYLIEGNQVLIGAIGDQPTVAGIRLQNTIGDNSGAIVSGYTITGPVEATVAGLSLGAGVNRSTIIGNNFSYAPTGIAVDSTAVLAPAASNTILNNTNGTLSTQFALGGTYHNRLVVLPTADRVYISSANQSGVGADPSALELTANGTGGFINLSVNAAAKFQVLNGGGINLTNTFRFAVSRTPASATEACTAGDFAWDANYHYQCVATNTWKRAALAAW